MDIVASFYGECVCALFCAVIVFTPELVCRFHRGVVGPQGYQCLGEDERAVMVMLY